MIYLGLESTWFYVRKGKISWRKSLWAHSIIYLLNTRIDRRFFWGL